MFAHYTADQVKEQTMIPLVSAITQYLRRSRLDRGHHRSSRRKPRRRRLWLELLEDRTTPSVSISVANASLNEIGNVSAFVASGGGGLTGPKDLVQGPDGSIYVVSSGNNSVIRYSSTGALLGTFVAAGSGGLSNPYGLAFGPDGNLYVDSTTNNNILEYSGSTGAFLNTFVSAGSGGLSDPRGMIFAQDGNLYVSSRGTQSVDRFQGPAGPAPGSPLPAVGQSGATFVPTGSGGLAGPLDLIFGPNGNLFVANGTPMSGVTNNNFGVLEYNATSGAFITTYVGSGSNGVTDPRGIAFDQEGRMYVADFDTNAIHRFDSQGNYLDDPVTSAASSLQSPIGMVFDAQGGLLVTSRDGNAVYRYDRGVTVTLSAASATAVSANYATADGTATAGKDYTAETGTVTFALGQTSRLILLTTRAESVMDGNETFSLQLSNPTGATIGTGTATVTIVDPTFPQISVTDTSAIEGDTTAHYRGDLVGDPTISAFYGVAFGPDGNLYTSPTPGPNSNAILRYNGTTGAPMGIFVPTGIINGVRDIVFHNGYMFVSGEGSSEVFKGDATTGAYLGVFASGNINGSFGLAFGPDGNLYVSGRESASVVEYDGTTGAYIRTFVASGSNGMSLPEGLTFDPSGQFLYVASSGSNQVLKYNAQTGAFAGVAASSNMGLTYVKFGSDGLLYVLTNGIDRIMRFNENGTYIDDYVGQGSGGMSFAEAMTFGPTGDLYVVTNQNNRIMQFGTENEALFTVSFPKLFPEPVTVSYATADGTALAGTNYTAISGTLTFAPNWSTAMLRVPILDSGSQTTPLSFTVNLSNCVGATLLNSQATGTLEPSDQAAKFYVVNDPNSGVGGNHATFKYQASGTEQAPYFLSLADLAPMGVAANAAGTMEWVVDANKNVYIYNSSGVLLGSWSAGGLSSSAQLTGIATDGTNIWLLDSSTASVYEYAGAASRLSGSQNAASSFNLPGGKKGNTNPQDIVTDGTSFWLVDGTKLKVFKYTLSGSLLGSWAIDPANTHPTGITINPNNVSDIWIVDNGTDKVYQYIGAASRTSGSQNAGATFALAAGNTNPQGIADPPVSGMDSIVAPATGSVVATKAATPIDASAASTVDWSWLADATRSLDLGWVQGGENPRGDAPAIKPPEAAGSWEWKPAISATISTPPWGSSADALAARDQFFAGVLDDYGTELTLALADAGS
jgi:sugar lactone lactonase YvrE